MWTTQACCSYFNTNFISVANHMFPYSITNLHFMHIHKFEWLLQVHVSQRKFTKSCKLFLPSLLAISMFSLFTEPGLHTQQQINPPKRHISMTQDFTVIIWDNRQGEYQQVKKLVTNCGHNTWNTQMSWKKKKFPHKVD